MVLTCYQFLVLRQFGTQILKAYNSAPRGQMDYLALQKQFGTENLEPIKSIKIIFQTTLSTFSFSPKAQNNQISLLFQIVWVLKCPFLALDNQSGAKVSCNPMLVSLGLLKKLLLFVSLAKLPTLLPPRQHCRLNICRYINQYIYIG